jgi:pimeloyl-ACP methyl ester carboxylesterase
MPKPVIVLLHGVGLDHTMWRPVSTLLQDEFEVVTPDLLGHGGNAPAPDGTTLRDLADDVARSLSSGTHLVGFSLGALVAQHLARYRPELVATLTSVNSVCRRTESERTAVLGRLATAGTDFASGVEASLRRWYDGTGVDPALVAQTRDTLLANDIASYLNCYRVFATGDAEIGPELPRISVPALAMTGELDPGSTPEMTWRLAAAMRDCRAVVVPGARHMLPVQRPRDLVTPLTTFIRERGHVASQSV